MTDMNRTKSSSLRLNQRAGSEATSLNPAAILLLCGLLAIIPACGGGNGFEPPATGSVSAITLGNSGAGAPVANVTTPTNLNLVRIQFSVAGAAGASVSITPKYYVDANANDMQDAGENSFNMTESAVDENDMAFTSQVGTQTIPASGTFEGTFFWDAMTDLGGLDTKYGVLICVDVNGAPAPVAPAEQATPTQRFAASSASSPIMGSISAPMAAGTGRTMHTSNLVSGLDGMASPTDMGAEVLVAGGTDSTAAAVNSFDRFSIDVAGGTAANSNSATGATARVGHSSAMFLDSTGKNVRILVTGGGAVGMSTSSADVYTFGPNGTMETVTSTATSMAFARRDHASCWLPNNTILITGGLDGSNNIVNSAEIYDPSNPGSPFSTVAGGPIDLGRTGHTQTLLPDGTVLIAGGVDASNNAVSPYIFNPSNGTFTVAPVSSGGSMAGSVVTIDRKGHTATLMVNGIVALAGGTNAAGTMALDSVSFYRPFAVTDAATNLNIPAGFTSPNRRNGTTEISPAQPIQSLVARERASASRLGDGRLLFVSGENPGGGITSSEFFVPFSMNDNAIGEFTLTNPAGDPAFDLTAARTNHTQTTLQDGSVAVIGGDTSGTPLDTIEVFRFSNSRPTVSNVAATALSGGNSTITFDLADAENDRSFVIVRFSNDGGTTFRFATLSSYQGTVNLAPATGITLSWNAAADGLMAGDSVIVEVIPVGGAFGDPARSAATNL